MALLKVQWGLFLFSEHDARMGHQRHKWKENEQVEEPLNFQQGPSYTLLAV